MLSTRVITGPHPRAFIGAMPYALRTLRRLREVCHPFRSDNVSMVDQLVLSLESRQIAKRAGKAEQICMAWV